MVEPAEQQVALVTGASRGIGAGLVVALRARGSLVVVTSRAIDAGAWREDPGVHVVAGDVGRDADAERIVSEAYEHFGRIDTLVNNAGVFIAKPFEAFDEDDFTTMVSTNLGGFFRVTRRVLPHMLAAGTGHVVNITASLAKQPMSAVPSVLTSLTKGGLDAATQALALEYAGRGIRVNAVSPGVIRTPMHAPEAHPFLAGLAPVGRMGEVADIVDAVLYLQDAAFVTGEVLHVDGGAQAGRW